MGFTIQIIGHLLEELPQAVSDLVVDLPAGLTIREILAEAGIIPDLVMTVLVNGERQNKDHIPPAGATLTCLSALAGG